MHEQPGVGFVYLPARDLAAMRTFYGHHLGLHEIYHSDADGIAAFRCGTLQFTIYTDVASVPATGWATQPGWEGDTRPGVSWSVVLDATGYREAVSSLHAAGVEALHEMPVWVGYWSFPVHDPMGNTVELSLPMEEPEITSWSAFADDTSPGTTTTD